MKTTNENQEGAKLAQNASLATGAVTLGMGALSAVGADAALVIQDINLTSGEQVTGGRGLIDDPFTFDLDQDGSDDFRVLNETPFQKHAAISSLGFTKTVAFGIAIDDGVPTAFFGNGIFQDDQGYTSVFAPGGEVDGSGSASNYAEFFNGSGGPFSEIGATGYIGLQLQLDDGVHYGWLEVSRGSITGHRAGFQTTPGAAAPIPGGGTPPAGVPEPAGLPILAAGAAGIAFMQRRRKKVAVTTEA